MAPTMEAPWLFLLVATSLALVAAKPLHIDPVSYNHAVEPHHSIFPPMDKHLVYWNFGGSTVMAKNNARLTPATQDRKGWLWNEYPLEKENWEVEVLLEVYSKPHFGGDGFGMWVLAGDQDPTFSTEPDYLNGPIFGLKKDFQGFGVIFDVYDNDNKRNNPSVFVLANFEGGKTKFNHDNDYEDDMIKATPEHIPGHADLNDAGGYKSYQCVADFRNSGKPAKVLMKYLHQVLHVYIDTGEGQGYRFCLAVELEERSFIDYHLAFTAATGQVADTHDLKFISTRYLSESDQDLDDTTMIHFGTSGASGGYLNILRGFIALGGLALLGWAGFQLNLFRNLQGSRLDASRIAYQLNQNLMEHYSGHVILFVLLLLSGGSWFTVLLNVPLLAFRGYSKYNNTLQFNEAAVSGMGVKGHGNSHLLSAQNRLYLDFGFYAVLELLYLYQSFF